MHRLKFSEYKEGVLRGDRIALSRAITLIESELREDRMMGDRLVQELLPATGKAMRVGITGAPGVGKSSFIEVLGQYLVAASKKVAVLAIDPGSKQTKGSILGDKTRMESLARNKNTFIRPSSAGTKLGGVHHRTREAILLCEAAGFDTVIVETVGVGQSEISVYEMVDFFMLLLLGGGGDGLQGIKRGVMEIADSIVITKSDGDNIKRTREAQFDCQQALHFLSPTQSGWIPKVLLSSALEKKGVAAIWDTVEQFKKITLSNGFFAMRRQQQVKEWFHATIENNWKSEIMQITSLQKDVKQLEQQVLSGKLIPPQAARQLIKELAHFLQGLDGKNEEKRKR